MSIHALPGDRPQDALGYVAEKTSKEDCRGAMVLTFDDDGTVCARSFGRVTAAALALASGMLMERAMCVGEPP